MIIVLSLKKWTYAIFVSLELVRLIEFFVSKNYNLHFRKPHSLLCFLIKFFNSPNNDKKATQRRFNERKLSKYDFRLSRLGDIHKTINKWIVCEGKRVNCLFWYERSITLITHMDVIICWNWLEAKCLIIEMRRKPRPSHHFHYKMILVCEWLNYIDEDLHIADFRMSADCVTNHFSFHFSLYVYVTCYLTPYLRIDNGIDVKQD